MKRLNEELLQEIARKEDEAEELELYRSLKEYPPNVQPNQVNADMANQFIFLLVFGNPIPFQHSTIKNVVPSLPFL